MSIRPEWLFVPDVKNWLPASGRVIWISRQIRTKRALIGTLRRRLPLPSCYGENWDALRDALLGLNRADLNGGVALVHDGLPFSTNSARNLTNYLAILTDVLESSTADGLPWQIVFPESCREELLHFTGM